MTISTSIYFYLVSLQMKCIYICIYIDFCFSYIHYVRSKLVTSFVSRFCFSCLLIFSLFYSLSPVVIIFFTALHTSPNIVALFIVITAAAAAALHLCTLLFCILYHFSPLSFFKPFRLQRNVSY